MPSSWFRIGAFTRAASKSSTRPKREVDAGIIETGEQAAYGLASPGCTEIIKLIGRMKWRTSMAGILAHSKEVSFLAGIMAAELGLDVAIAKRGALLHDIGRC